MSSMTPTHRSSALQFALAALIAAPALAGGAAYEIIDLGVAPGRNASAGVDVNALGHVAIGSWNNGDGDANNTAELWIDLNGDGVVNAGERMNMGSLGGGETLVQSMNGIGASVGSGENGEAQTLAFRWVPGGAIMQMQSLPGIHAEAYGVNDAGVAVGKARTLPLGNGSSRFHAVMWSEGGAITDITPIAASIHTQALRINNAGHILGGRTDSGGAWVVRDGATHFLPGSTTLIPGDLDEAGDAVGFVRSGGVAWQACRWIWNGSGYSFAPLPGLPGYDDTFARGTNNLGDTVGSASGASQRAVLWPAGGVAFDLNSLIEPGSGWVLREAFAINDDGVIVGYGDKNGAEFRAFLLRPNLEADTDGDGLLDTWEVKGIPYDDGMGGELYFQLPGADPLHKDLYVEVDSMVGHPLSQAAVDEVEFAFDTSPLQNPDGAAGVRLHVLLDDADIPHVAVWMTDGCWPTDFDAYRSAYYGSDAERAFANAPALLAAKAKAYRYCIVADSFGPAAIGGCGQMPGDNFVIVGYADPGHAAAVFMHELGHNLGLRHGGGDSINGKPNYPSIMNYAQSYKYAWNSAFWRLDFSRVGASGFATLDESSLDETAGVGTAGGYYDNYFMPFGVTANTTGSPAREVRYVPLNGAPTDFGDDNGTPYQDGDFTNGIAQDLNYVVMPPAGISLPSAPSPGQVFAPHDDWARVTVGLPLAATLGLRGVEPEYPDDELTTEARDWIDQNFPMPPAACPGDVNGDNRVDFADLNIVLADFNVAAPGLPGDVDNDGDVDFADLNVVVSAFNTTCGGGGGGGKGS